ncbi:MAG: hypothetical protein KR126chlam6_01418 [Candidatus Anoxychlamydiales bacterium]|nr:hypothetical protein [Candidatus Anoxychlamydiales bacterium]
MAFLELFRLDYLTLVRFIELHNEIDSFLIDPEISNLKAIHVYEKTGFKKVGSHIPKTGCFSGIEHIIMKKECKIKSS